MLYEWLAFYNDGGKAAQFDGDRERSFGEVDQNKLSHFALKEVGGRHLILVDLTTGHFHIGQATDAGLVAGLEIVPQVCSVGCRPIWFRRMRVIADPGGDLAAQDPFVYGWGIGWQATVEGRNVQYVAVVRATDGGIEWEADRRATPLRIGLP
jgi:hypothetical protein